MAKVLVVDDSAVDRLLAGRLLEKNADLTVLFAADGSEALTQFEREPPDIVVTDLQMPVFSGLQLVEAIRDRYPLVPVILMTAHGSEDIAVQALLSGAASYVPKSELARHLLETVLNVLNVARFSHQHRRLMGSLELRQMSYELDNDSSLISPLVDQVQQLLASVQLVDTTARMQTAIALEEALFNALYHGNLELTTDDVEQSRSSLLEPGAPNPLAERLAVAPYRDRKIRVQIHVGRDEARFVVSDDGQGFNPATVANPADPTTLTSGRGRGLVLMRMFMDEVQHNSVGNEVSLVKRRQMRRETADN